MKRNLSMDLLKVIAMLMVVLRHSLSQGGILEINEGNTIWFFGIGFRSLSVIAVNVFVLVTSYLMTEKKVSYFGLIKLMLQVIFYSWIIYIGLVVFKLNEFNPKI